jgi:hypothetical protein
VCSYDDVTLSLEGRGTEGEGEPPPPLDALNKLAEMQDKVKKQ